MRNCTRLADILDWRVTAFCARWFLCFLNPFFRNQRSPRAAQLTEIRDFHTIYLVKMFLQYLRKRKEAVFEIHFEQTVVIPEPSAESSEAT